MIFLKTPLRFQMTEFDCGTVSILNAIMYLYKREEIPAELVKVVTKYSLDCYDKKGNIGQGGTSREAIEKICEWLTKHVKSNNYGLNCEHLLNKDVTIDKIKQCIDNDGCVLFRTYQDCEHYVLLTDYDDNSFYLWDPYYLDEKHYNNDKDVKIDFEHPFKYNRIVSIKRFLSVNKEDFSFNLDNKRECVLFNKEQNSKKF